MQYIEIIVCHKYSRGETLERKKLGMLIVKFELNP